MVSRLTPLWFLCYALAGVYWFMVGLGWKIIWRMGSVRLQAVKGEVRESV